METWEKEPSSYSHDGSVLDWRIRKYSPTDTAGTTLADCLTEEVADAIIRDHKLAALAEEMRVAALRRYRNDYPT